jgi:hypothetical protein
VEVSFVHCDSDTLHFCDVTIDYSPRFTPSNVLDCLCPSTRPVDNLRCLSDNLSIDCRRDLRNDLVAWPMPGTCESMRSITRLMDQMPRFTSLESKICELSFNEVTPGSQFHLTSLPHLGSIPSSEYLTIFSETILFSLVDGRVISGIKRLAVYDRALKSRPYL